MGIIERPQVVRRALSGRAKSTEGTRSSRHYETRRALATGALVALAAAALPVADAGPALAAPAATCSACGRNLILNPGAEAGPGTNSDSVVKVPDWKGTGGFTAAQYAWSGGDLSPTTPGPKNRGKNYFYGGPDAATSIGTQVIAIPAGAVSSGKIDFLLSGWLGGYSSQGDNAALTVAFLNSTGSALAASKIGPVTEAQRDGNSELLYRQYKGVVPATTTRVSIRLVILRTDGSDNDGMADNLGLVFSPAPAKSS